MSTGMLWAIMVAALLLNVSTAFSETSPIRGKFYADIDDTVDIYHNGRKIHHGDIGTSASREIDLAPGDRIVLDLWNKHGPYGLKLLFVSTDRKTMINFGVNSFRVLRDPEKWDMTEREFIALKDPAHGINRKTGDHLAFKNKADWLWGEKKKGHSYLASLVNAGMFDRFIP